MCRCTASWGGPDCSFLLVQATYETDENGGDGDDPAIWIAPGDTGNSRIITTTKSVLGAGFGVFDLTGKKLQTVEAAEPNNVDVIYGFRAGNRTVDLVFAACRGDDTLWYDIMHPIRYYSWEKKPLDLVACGPTEQPETVAASRSL